MCELYTAVFCYTFIIIIIITQFQILFIYSLCRNAIFPHYDDEETLTKQVICVLNKLMKRFFVCFLNGHCYNELCAVTGSDNSDDDNI